MQNLQILKSHPHAHMSLKYEIKKIKTHFLHKGKRILKKVNVGHPKPSSSSICAPFEICGYIMKSRVF